MCFSIFLSPSIGQEQNKTCTEGDKLQEGLYRKRKSFRFQPFYPLTYLDIIQTYIIVKRISCKIF